MDNNTDTHGNAIIAGIGSHVPLRIVTNDDLSKIVDTSDEWIASRTGIKERRISTGETTSQIAAEAAQKALKDAKINAEEIDLIIVATCTPDSFMPSVACLVQKEIGAINATCFDISAACSGFIYAFATAKQFLESPKFNCALVIGADIMSKILDWNDRATCVLFGDGAGAAVVKKSEEGGLLYITTGSDGRDARHLECQGISIKNPYNENAVIESKSYITMNGKEIFKFGGKIIIDTVNKVLQETSLTIDDVAYIVPHQANYRIIEYAAKKLGINKEKFYLNLDRYGNTSSASIPLALDEMVSSHLLKTGDKIILIGFGGGLTWGAILIEWTK